MTTETEINGVTYQLATLDAMTQFHVMRRIMPIVGVISGDDAMERAFRALGELSDEDSEYVLNKCLTGCMRKNGDNWAKVYVNGRLMFEDIGLPGMLRLAVATLKEPIAGFFTNLAPILLKAGAE